LLGGTLCLDFANTLEWRGTSRCLDRLEDYAALVAWAERAGAIASAEAAWLRSCADWAPGSAGDALAQARDLREAIFRVVSAFASGEAPGAGDLEALNGPLFALVAKTCLEATDGGFMRAWAGEADAPERVLWPIAWSAHELLTGPEVGRLRVCANDDCHWLFLDRSKNRSRRWCAMWNCGNVEKARRHRRRHRAPVPG
jgi:predicted RNA-binding Zn ribbon-like protein